MELGGSLENGIYGVRELTESRISLKGNIYIYRERES